MVRELAASCDAPVVGCILGAGSRLASSSHIIVGSERLRDVLPLPLSLLEREPMASRTGAHRSSTNPCRAILRRRQVQRNVVDLGLGAVGALNELYLGHAMVQTCTEDCKQKLCSCQQNCVANIKFACLAFAAPLADLDGPGALRELRAERR